MKLLQLQTNFTFKGSRKYIHSTSLCDFIVRGWCNFSGDELTNASISIDIHEEARTNGKLIYFDSKQSIKEIGATCESEVLINEKVASYCYFIEEHSFPAKEDSPSYDLSNFEIQSDFSGSCMLTVDSSLMLLENVVEANKRIHLMCLDAGDYNVLNIYMKNFPFSILKLGGKQRLHVENRRKRPQMGGVATISDFWFELEPKKRFQISFYVRKI